MKTAITTTANRQHLDRYITPPWMVQELVRRQPLDGVILECCAGRENSISDYLRSLGHDVITADVDPLAEVNYTLDMSLNSSWETILKHDYIDHVVSNLPFNLADSILQHAYTYATTGVSVLLRSTWHEALMTGTRAQWLYEHPVTQRISLPRYSFCISPKTGKPASDSCALDWFIWRKDGWLPEYPNEVVPHTQIKGFYKRFDKHTAKL